MDTNVCFCWIEYVKKCSKKKFWKYLKVTAKPKVMKTSKRSLKMSRKVMEFEELKRVQTLYERSDKKWV